MTLKRLEFKPGYYEWNLWCEDELLYAWDDFLDDLSDNVTEEEACDEADLLMYQLRNDYKEQGKEMSEDFFVAASELIANEIYRRYAA